MTRMIRRFDSSLAHQDEETSPSVAKLVMQRPLKPKTWRFESSRRDQKT